MVTWRSEAEHATSRSRRLPAILTFTRGWGRNQTAETGNRTPNSGVKGSGANHYPRAPARPLFKLLLFAFARQYIRLSQTAGSVFIVAHHIVSYRIVSYRIVSYRIVSYRIVSHRIVSYNTLSYTLLYCIFSYRILSHRIGSYRIISCRVLLYRIVTVSNRSFRIVSYRIVSYRIVSKHLNMRHYIDIPTFIQL